MMIKLIIVTIRTTMKAMCVGGRAALLNGIYGVDIANFEHIKVIITNIWKLEIWVTDVRESDLTYEDKGYESS